MRNIKTKKNSGIFLTAMEDKEIEAMSNALQNCSEGHLCFWWRRGRARPHFAHRLRIALAA